MLDVTPLNSAFYKRRQRRQKKRIKSKKISKTVLSNNATNCCGPFDQFNPQFFYRTWELKKALISIQMMEKNFIFFFRFCCFNQMFHSIRRYFVKMSEWLGDWVILMRWRARHFFDIYSVKNLWSAAQLEYVTTAMKLLTKSGDVALVAAPVFQWISTDSAHWPVGKLRVAFDVTRQLLFSW